jgi:hypothetical protein
MVSGHIRPQKALPMPLNTVRRIPPRQRTFLIGLGAFALAAAACVYGSPMSAYALETRLQRAADDAMARSNADRWAEVTVSGQRAVIIGTAPTEADRERALMALRAATWTGGVVAGGITVIVDETEVRPARGTPRPARRV